MFVVTAEGHRWVDRGTGSTHAVIGVYPTRELALETVKGITKEEDEAFFITDSKNLVLERIPPLLS